jgi:hypothetical protein
MSVDLSLKNPAITAGSSGSGSATWTVPANWHHFKARTVSQVLAGAEGALVSGALVILDGSLSSIVVPDATGLYAVTPGQSLLLLFSFYNPTLADIAADIYQAVVTLERVN